MRLHLSLDFTGRTIDNGRYQFTQRLGTGTFGAVYRAIDHQAGTWNSPQTMEVAIKIMSKTQSTGDQERTLHRAMSDHPNVVTLHRDFEDEDYVYLVLDYHPSDLCKLIYDGRFWRNTENIRKIFLQILDAVEACHARGIYHRDLKPSNILCNKEGTKIFLADFGIATTERRSINYKCGTVTYMSPGKSYNALPS